MKSPTSLRYDPEDAWGNVGPYDLVPLPSTAMTEPVAVVDSRTCEVVGEFDTLGTAVIEAGKQCNLDNVGGWL